MKPRKHLDLFSGIGGFALAAKWAGFQTVAFCECEKYAQKVLRKNFPGVPIHEDVKKLNGRQFEGLELLTGGFPCQPYSQAGKQRGEKDDRALWGEMARVIQEARPRWVLGENVVGLVSLGLDFVLSKLESLGYTCEALIIPACAVDAPHRRDRVWIIANSNGARLERSSSQRTRRSERQKPEVQNGLSAWSSEESKWLGKRWPNEPELSRVGNGIPDRLDRIKALGNAIVPQVAYELLRLMK